MEYEGQPSRKMERGGQEMELVEHRFTSAEIRDLARLESKILDFVGTSGMVMEQIFTCPMFIRSTDQLLELVIEDNEELVDGWYETLTKVHVTTTQVRDDDEIPAGVSLVHAEGERCMAVFVIEEELTKLRNGVTVANVASHSGVVLQLERQWIAIQRRGFHGFDYVVDQAPSPQDLVFFESAQEFPRNPIVRYQYGRTLIPISG